LKLQSYLPYQGPAIRYLSLFSNTGKHIFPCCGQKHYQSTLWLPFFSQKGSHKFRRIGQNPQFKQLIPYKNNIADSAEAKETTSLRQVILHKTNIAKMTVQHLLKPRETQATKKNFYTGVPGFTL
jgi:hypothetical protein